MYLSVLDLAPLKVGGTFEEAMETMIQLAQAAEKVGYKRFWLAEHHNTKAFGSSATAILIQHTLANTKTIRVGSGGVMLPNHSPYVIAEQYATLERLYPGRVDLGLGRAPGTDRQTAMVLRRSQDLYSDFTQEVAELEGYFKDTMPVHAYPAPGLEVPLYILGSSTDSAYLAAYMGLPYAFASHFAPAMLEEAVRIYRKNFQPSAYLDKPYVIVGLHVTAAETDEKARRLATTGVQMSVDLINGNMDGLRPPVDNEQEIWDSIANKVLPAHIHFGPVQFQRDEMIRQQKAAVNQMRAAVVVGGPETLKKEYLALKEKVKFEEVMVTTAIYDAQDMIKSFEIFKKVVDETEEELKNKAA